ncbi:MAG: class I SAM-dependent methyltransferase [Solirubrobacterales bacterium]
MATGAPANWYRTSFASDFNALYFEEGGAESARLAVEMLGLEGRERILDLACATGGRSIELARRGFDVIGVDIRAELLEVASGEAQRDCISPWFAEEDPRYLDYEAEFDVVLSLGGGAFEHFEYDAENERAFGAAARALRPGGRLLMQMPNVLHAEAELPERTWYAHGQAIDLIEQHWNAATHRLDGARRSIIEFESAEYAETMSFQRRLYTIEELAEIFEAIGLGLTDVYDESGAPCAPSVVEQELYVEARA